MQDYIRVNEMTFLAEPETGFIMSVYGKSEWPSYARWMIPGTLHTEDKCLVQKEPHELSTMMNKLVVTSARMIDLAAMSTRIMDHAVDTFRK